MTESKVSMKLLIDTKEKRVLFAEVSKDCVDFLFNILSLPVAAVISLLKEKGTVGSLTNLYESIENLNESYIQAQERRNNILKPFVSADSVPLLALEGVAKTARTFFKCGNCNQAYVTDDSRAVCPNCRRNMSVNATYVAPPAVVDQASGGSDQGGIVKGVVTYMVMDDLVVTPMSTISSITLLNKLSVKDVGALEEKVVLLGMAEALKLLKASLQSKNVLTHVFLS